MNRPNTWKFLVVLFLLTMFAGAFALSTGLAQFPSVAPKSPIVSVPDEVNSLSDSIPVQGRLTDSNGVALDGSYDIIFRLYDTFSGGTPLCEDPRTLQVNNGLFNSHFYGAACPIEGQQLYLGIQIEDDPEMAPRLSIENVPYAWTLRPGATIEYPLDDFLFFADNTGPGGAILGRNIQPGEYGPGVTGISTNSQGVYGRGVYEDSIGVLADSDLGVALRAAGTGIIQSSATSTLWISGNSVRPFNHADTTIIDLNNNGGAAIYSGAAAGTRNVMVPITLPGQLYGQDITLTDLDIYWVGDTVNEAISAVLLRRQIGVCGGPTCYATILHDSSTQTCFDDDHPTGCTEHFNLTSNNVISDDFGILYLTIELYFSSGTNWITIGGVRLTLAHE